MARHNSTLSSAPEGVLGAALSRVCVWLIQERPLSALSAAEVLALAGVLDGSVTGGISVLFVEAV